MELKERTSATGLHAHVLDQVERLHLPKDSRILDLGCGTGALLARLQMAGYVNLTGIDIAPPPENAAVSASWKPISMTCMPIYPQARSI